VIDSFTFANLVSFAIIIFLEMKESARLPRTLCLV